MIGIMTVFASCVCACLCVPVTCRYCIETASQIELIFLLRVSLDLCYAVF